MKLELYVGEPTLEKAIHKMANYNVTGLGSNFIIEGKTSAMIANACESNSSLWQLSDPVCSINFSSFWVFVCVAILLGIITVWTVFGNALVWLALYRFPNLRSMSNLLIGNLALSDCLLALTVLPISTGNDILGYWIFGEELCHIWLCIDVLYCTASIWGLCTIAVDRYTATVFPVWYYERRSPMRALVYIIFVWLFSIVVSLAPFIGWREMIPDLYQYNPIINRYECILFQTEGYVVYSAIGSFVLPIFLMTFIYVRIFGVLKKRMKLLKPKRHISFPSESDIESGVIPDAISRMDLHSGTNCTEVTQMKDQATQISPLLTKSKGNFLLEPKGFAHNTNHLVKSNTIVGIKEAKMMSDESQSKTDLTKMKYSVNVVNICDKSDKNDVENNSCSEPILPNNNSVAMDTQNLNKEKNVKENNVSKPSKNLSLPNIVIKKSDSNQTNICDDDESVSRSEITGSQRENGHCVDNMNEKKRKRRKNKKKIKIDKNLNSPKTNCTSDEKLSPPTKRTGSKGKNSKNRHLTSIKTKYELREQRATKRMAIVMACFCVCWIPFLLMYVIRSFCASCDLNVHIQAAIIWLGYANSGLNPILYTLFNDDFRKAFKTILHLDQSSRKKKKAYIEQFTRS